MGHEDVSAIAMVVQAIWPILVAFVLIIAWFIRLEAKVLNLESNHTLSRIEAEKTANNLYRKIEDVQKALQEISTSVGRLEGQLKGAFDHQQGSR